MTETTNENEQLQPLVPPWILLTATAVGIVVALLSALVQGSFGVLSYAFLGIGLISFIALIVFAPSTIVNAVTGRTFRFGGTSVFITLLLIVVLSIGYILLDQAELSYDVTGTDEFKLNEQATEAITLLGVDPNTPEIEITAFYTTGAVAQQEQAELLLNDYQESSNGKISVQFINPDRQPAIAQQFNAVDGSLVIYKRTEDGQPDLETSETVNARFGFNQNTITNAILSVASSGDFRVVALAVEEGISITDVGQTGASDIVSVLEERFGWTVDEAPYFTLVSPDGEIQLGDATADGEVLIIIGGTKPLSDEESTFVIDYMENGGNVVLFAEADIDGPALASTEPLNDYFESAFGVRFDDRIILDPTQALQSINIPIISDIRRTSYITANVQDANYSLVMPFARAITVSESAPDGVTLNELAFTSAGSYAKTIEQLLAEDVELGDGDESGPFAVAIAAENTNTGSRLVLFGSAGFASNQFSLFQEIGNAQVAFNALVWTTGFNDFFEELPQVDPFDFRPQDTPVSASASQLQLINLISVVIVPFSVLGMGIIIWWMRRRNV